MMIAEWKPTDPYKFLMFERVAMPTSSVLDTAELPLL